MKLLEMLRTIKTAAEEANGKLNSADNVANPKKDGMYNQQTNETKLVGSRTLERGPLPTTPFKPGFDYFTLQLGYPEQCHNHCFYF
jgi:hypothetical protein